MYDLGLDAPPSKDLALMLAFNLKGGGKQLSSPKVLTLEERRALLGCFLMSSVYVNTTKQLSKLIALVLLLLYARGALFAGQRTRRTVCGFWKRKWSMSQMHS